LPLVVSRTPIGSRKPSAVACRRCLKRRSELGPSPFCNSLIRACAPPGNVSARGSHWPGSAAPIGDVRSPFPMRKSRRYGGAAGLHHRSQILIADRRDCAPAYPCCGRPQGRLCARTASALPVAGAIRPYPGPCRPVNGRAFELPFGVLVEAADPHVSYALSPAMENLSCQEMSIAFERLCQWIPKTALF
jgi:hypothetical protein